MNPCTRNSGMGAGLASLPGYQDGSSVTNPILVRVTGKIT